MGGDSSGMNGSTNVDNNTLAQMEKNIIDKVNNLLKTFHDKYTAKEDLNRNLQALESNVSS